MSDDIWARDEVESPCNKVCMIHPDAKICIGCHRTGDEIMIWSRLSPEARRAIMDELPSRAATIPARRGGRAARLKQRDG